jgi:hypothetical protein
MTQTATERSFEGPFKKQLGELASLIDWLETEHDKSYVKAGDDKVYAFGGGGYVLVLDESVWNGLIEMITPKGGVSIKPVDEGRIAVIGPAGEDEKTLKARLTEGTEEIRNYYENRYWSTPKTSA